MTPNRDQNRDLFSTLSINGSDITITYTGTLAGDELKLTRVVGEFGTEQLTAKRAAAPPAK